MTGRNSTDVASVSIELRQRYKEFSTWNFCRRDNLGLSLSLSQLSTVGRWGVCARDTGTVPVRLTMMELDFCVKKNHTVLNHFDAVLWGMCRVLFSLRTPTHLGFGGSASVLEGVKEKKDADYERFS